MSSIPQEARAAAFARLAATAATNQRPDPAQVQELALKIEEIFGALTPRHLQPPAQAHCQTIAGYLLTERRLASMREPPEALRAVRDSAHTYLKHVGLWRDHQLAAGAAFAKVISPEEAAIWNGMREKIEASVRSVENMLKLLATFTQKGDVEYEYDPIRVLARLARWAWASANDGETPSGTSENGPLTKFVKKVLDACGMGHISERGIRDVLEGRRRVPRPRKSTQ